MSNDTPGPGPVHARLLRVPADLAEQMGNLPTVDPNKYALLDDDAQTCRIIEDDEFDAGFIDKNIKTYKLDAIESWPQVPNPDIHNVVLTYDNGNQTTVLIGSISLDNGPQPDQYFKSQNIIYPIDKAGTALLDATNTPNLSYIRQHYWDMVRQKAAYDLLIAEIVATFASAVAASGHAGEAGNFVTAEDIDGTVPTPADPPENKVDSSGSDQSGSGSGSDQGN